MEDAPGLDPEGWKPREGPCWHRSTHNFTSHGTRCEAWLFLPSCKQGPGSGPVQAPPPVIVMAAVSAIPFNCTLICVYTYVCARIRHSLLLP